jgi:hypothetical protein
MAEYKDREHYIPLRRSDLIELLCKDKGLPAADREQFRQFCRLVTAWYHFQYHEQLEELKNEYAPFDPDTETKPIRELLPEEREQQLQQLYQKFNWLLERCNFKRLTREDLQKATEIASDWGVNMDIDFSAFDYLEVYVRGDSIGQRYLRRWPRFWKLEPVKVPVYQRMAMILKQRKHKRLGPGANTRGVYLKLFKDIPKVDIEMLIPGGRLKMPGLARGKLGATMLGTGGFVGYKIFTEMGVMVQGFLLRNPLAFWGPLSLVLGYGYKQFAGYQGVKKTYSFQLTQSLYYQTLDSNAGVLFHLLDEAEEQECREAILAYYYMWRYPRPDGWTAPNLDDYVEMDLERLANLKVDFEIEDALDKLEKLGIVEKSGGRYRALPLDKALEIIDYKWDNYFQYNKALT